MAAESLTEFMQNVFKYALQREYGAEEFAHHSERISSGAIGEVDFLYEVLECEEFVSLGREDSNEMFVGLLCGVFRGHEAEADELERHVPRLDEGMGRRELAIEFAAGDEGEVSVGVSAEVPSVEVSMDAPSVEVSVDVPSVEVSVDVEVSSVEVSVDVPSVELSVEAPSVDISVEVPSVEVSVDVPSVEVSIDAPSVEVSVGVSVGLSERNNESDDDQDDDVGGNQGDND